MYTPNFQRNKAGALYLMSENVEVFKLLVLFVLPLTLLVVLASSTSDDKRKKSNRNALQTTAPSGLGTSGNGW